MPVEQHCVFGLLGGEAATAHPNFVISQVLANGVSAGAEGGSEGIGCGAGSVLGDQVSDLLATQPVDFFRWYDPFRPNCLTYLGVRRSDKLFELTGAI